MTIFVTNKKTFFYNKMDSQFRVDNHDDVKFLKLMKSFAVRHQAKYLVCKEIGLISGKPHLQGWVSHTSSDNSYRKYWARQYPEFGKKDNGKCFTFVHDMADWVPYIIKQNRKPHATSVDSTSVLTNYTQAELTELYDKYPEHIHRDDRKKPARAKYQRDKLLQELEDTCVDDGRINYEKVHLTVVHNAHKYSAVDEFILYKRATAYALKLEEKYPNNHRAQERLYSRVCELDDRNGIFKNNVFSYLKFQANKKDAEEESDSSSEASGEESEEIF